MLKSLYCILGNTPALSLLELETLFPNQVQLALPSLAKITPTEEVNAQLLLNITGGTFKVLEELSSWTEAAVDQAGLVDWIGNYLQEKAAKPQFGVYCLGFGEQLVSEQDIKQYLKLNNHPSRFVDSSNKGVSSALFLHHPEIFDLLIVKSEGRISVLQSLVVQNIDDWTNRDRNKPYADRKKGMLPPKVARMMVVIGAGLPYQAYVSQMTADASATEASVANPNTETTSPVTILDPFCGTGTVVMEAAALGFAAIGSDSSNETIIQARDNITWFESEYPITHHPELFTADATASSLSDRLPNKVDVIVTEPFLGKPRAEFRQLPNIYKGLEKLYLGAFKRWRNVLRNQGRIAIVFPLVDTGKNLYSLESLIDKLPDLGYTITSGPIEYARTQATTRRQIYIFEYKQQ